MEDVQVLCVQIDEAIVDYFTCLDDVLQIQSELDYCLKDGFFNMAKARYSMGAKAVGSLQYNADAMVASIKVTPTVTDEDSGNPIVTFTNTEELSSAGQENGSVLRHRLTPNKQEDEKNRNDVIRKISDLSLKTDLESDDNDNETKPKSHNPLHWFGVLVPQSLRWSQRNFIQATELSVKLATAKARLSHALYHFRQLQCEKSIILNSDASELFLGSVEDLPNSSQITEADIDNDMSLADDVELLSREAMLHSDNLLGP